MRQFDYDDSVMCDLAIFVIHLLVTIARLFGPGGVQSVVAESLLGSLRYFPVSLNKIAGYSPYIVAVLYQ